MGRGFTSGGQESGSMFSTAVCIIQDSKTAVLVPKRTGRKAVRVDRGKVGLSLIDDSYMVMRSLSRSVDPSAWS